MHCIVLGHTGYTHDSMEASTGFVSHTISEFRHAYGEVSVAFDTLVEDLYVTRTIHRFEGGKATISLGDEHIVGSKFIPVSRFLIKSFGDDAWCVYLLVIVAA